MERDVNLKLIYIILILLLALVGTSVFYQMRYSSLRADYERSFNDMNQTIRNLTSDQRDLYSNISEFNISANREIALAARLEKKNLELEKISMELASIQQELFECRKNYDELSVNTTIADELLAKHAESIGRLQEKIDRLRTDVDNDAQKSVIIEDINKLQNELNSLKTY